MNSTLQIENVQVRYPFSWGRKSVVALDGFNLTLKSGEIFALLGPNGSGKTTLFKLILGFMKANKGSVRIEGEVGGSRVARGKIGYLPENPYFPKYLTGREILETYGRLSGLSPESLKERMESILDLVQMREFAEKRLHSYSKGMIQRVSLGQALIHDPQLLLLDEPTTGLDPQGVDAMREAMKKLRSMGKTILFTSHFLEQVESIADRVAILYQGKKLLEGSVEELLKVEGEARIEIKGWDTKWREELDLFFREKGIDAVQWHEGRGSLEEVFRRAIL